MSPDATGIRVLMLIPALLILALLLPASHACDDEVSVTAAREALAALGKHHEGLTTLTASYTQKRSSILMRKPIVSSGRLYFRKDPGCLVFRTEKPSATVIRLDAALYEVYRVEKKQLERFEIADQEWPQALFRTFSHQIDELDKSFTIQGSRLTAAGTPEEARIVDLQPKSEEQRRRMKSLRITLRSRDHLVVAIAYSDPRGDTVEIELDSIVTGTPIDEKLFEIDPAPGTKVIRHEAKAG